MKFKVKATVTIYDGQYKTIAKDFEVEPRENGKLYSEELVKWVEGHTNRTSNYFKVCFNEDKHTTKEYIYSL